MSKSLKLKIKTYEKTQGICIICCKMIEKRPAHWSLEHFLPRAIYKWLPDPELEARLESPANLFVVHKQCNLVKDSHLPNVAVGRILVSDTLHKGRLKTIFRRPFIGRNGAGEGNRTPDLRVTNALLYRLSYTGTMSVIIYIIKLFGNGRFGRVRKMPSENSVVRPAFRRPVRGIMPARPHGRA